MSQESSVVAEQPAPEHYGGTGPSEFEVSWHARNAAPNLAAAPEQGNGQTPQSQAAPQGSTEYGATTGSEGAESFLDPGQAGQFDTESPEYKAMQGAFTRKMQALAEREKALTERQQGQLDQQFNDSEQPQAANLEAIFANINPGIELPEELEPYRKPLASLAIDVAKQVVQQMQAQAEVQHAHQQKVEMTNKIRTQLREVQNGPRAQDFATHRDAVIALAQESPGLINRIGLSGILSIVAGPGKPQTMPIPNQNEQAASEMLQTLQSRRQAAMQPPSQSPTTATRAVPFTVPQGTSMNDAVAQAFADAQRRHG